MTHIPGARVQNANRAELRRDGEYVLYWMTAARRLEWSFALDHAIVRARELGKPLLLFEPLRAGYRWASDRIHRFVLDGMDERPHLYTHEDFAAARTHDDLWNAAQGQLLTEGRIHNYLRMLWGKKVLHWSASPQDALSTLIDLNNRYALDGRDPNSYSGIFWCLGRFDRPWAPERPIFGTVRYMSTESARRKFKVDGYVARYAPGAQLRLV